MWIVQLALRRPYTFVVVAILLLLVTPFVLLRTPTDIFPAINIPVVSVIWSYTGLTATDIEQRFVYTEERAITTTVNNIQHIESASYNGVGVIKVFFQQGASADAGVAQEISQSVTRRALFFCESDRNHSRREADPSRKAADEWFFGK